MTDAAQIRELVAQADCIGLDILLSECNRIGVRVSTINLPGEKWPHQARAWVGTTFGAVCSAMRMQWAVKDALRSLAEEMERAEVEGIKHVAAECGMEDQQA